MAGTAASLIAGSALAAPSAFAAPLLPNGFASAAVIAHSGQVITGDINATGYDLGIWIPPGVHGVRVQNAHVHGANDQGILVQDARDIVIRNNRVDGNTAQPYGGLQELKAIALAGTRNVLVTGNTVEGNGDGGIGIYDDGLNNQTVAPKAMESTPVPGVGNVVTGNFIKDNLNGCGIVVSARNVGGGVWNNLVSFNTVYSDPTPEGHAPFTGGIVVAGGMAGAVDVIRTVVLHNTVTGGDNPGIALHSGATATLSGTVLMDDVLRHTGAATGQHGIELAGAPGATSGTQVVHDTVIDDAIGVFHTGDVGTNIVALRTYDVAIPVFVPPAP